MLIHELLPNLIAFFGFVSGIYILGKINKLRVRNDRVMLLNFICLGLLNIYVGSVYSLVLLGMVSSAPSSEVAILMRPANMLQIVLPFFISWRMGL